MNSILRYAIAFIVLILQSGAILRQWLHIVSQIGVTVTLPNVVWFKKRFTVRKSVINLFSASSRYLAKKPIWHLFGSFLCACVRLAVLQSVLIVLGH